MPERHLTKLPEKSYKVAPGTPVGGLVYVMNKPCGIEEGMLGISKDSAAYRAFIKELIKNKTYDTQIRERISASRKDVTYPPKNDSQMEALIEFVLNDSKISKKGWWNPSYSEEGLSGLFFDAYKEKIGIKKDDKFYVEAAKLIKAGNKVYMIKQDGPMVLGGTGPTVSKIKTTSTYKNNKKNYGALYANLAAYAQRLYYIFSNNPKDVNEDAIVESLSTKMATAYGMNAQEIDLIEGTYANGEPKYCTAVTWSQGVNDLSGHLAGGEVWYTGHVCVAVDTKQNIRWLQDTGALVYKVADGYKKRTREGEILDSDETEYESGTYVPIRTHTDNETIFRVKVENDQLVYTQQKPDEDEVEVSAADYDKGYPVSDHNISGMGENLLTLLRMGDRDGVGKKGQNKAIMPILDADGNPTGQYSFFGIDFGKAFNGPNKLLPSLRDDFSVDTMDEAGANSCFPNYSMLYDNPLLEKMKGVYLFAAQKGQYSPEELDDIIEQFQAMGDDTFAQKLEDCKKPENRNRDGELIRAEHERLTNELAKAKSTGDKKNIRHFSTYLARVEEIIDIMKQNDERVLEVFDKRMHVMPKHIQVLDNLEKLSAKDRHIHKRGNNVRLNHIAVNPEARIPWQLEHNSRTNTYTLYVDTPRPEGTETHLQALFSNDKFGNLLPNYDARNLRFTNLTEQQMQRLSSELTEEFVAEHYHMPLRTNAHRARFNQQLGIGQEEPEFEAILEIDSGPPSPRASRDTDFGLSDSASFSDSIDAALEVQRRANTLQQSTDSEMDPLSVGSDASLNSSLDTSTVDPMSASSGSSSELSRSTSSADAMPQAEKRHLEPAQSDEPRKRQKPDPLAAQYREASRVVPAEARESVLIQESNLNVKDLKQTLSQDSVRKALGITSVRDRKVRRYKNNPGLEIEFKSQKRKTKGKVFKAYVEELPKNKQDENNHLAYSYDNNIEKNLEEETIRRICEMSILAAKPNTEIDLSQTPKDKQEMVHRFLTEAIQSSLKSKSFEKNNMPKIIGYDPNVKRLFTAHHPSAGG